MLNTEQTKELAQNLRNVADALEQTESGRLAIAEGVLDFERGIVSLPELTTMAREIVEEIG